MLADYFVNKVYPQGSFEEKEIVKKVFQDALAGNLCTTLEQDFVLLPGYIAAENPLEIAPKTVLCRLGTSYYLQKNWIYETEVVKAVEHLLASQVEPLKAFSLEGLNTQQKEAVSRALEYRLALITGGPGTGKTHTAARLVRCFLETCPAGRVILTAPTGKAVARLGSLFENCPQVEAKTLHSLLALSQKTNFLEEKAGFQADLVLVDESSMIDAALFSYFLSSIPEGTRVVLMGDPDQLPPVESGSLFADLAKVTKVPRVHLTECLRTNRKEILSLAQAVKDKEVEKVIGAVSSLDLWKEIEEYFPGPYTQQPLEEDLLARMEQFKILSCVRKGPWGVDTLNKAIVSHFLNKMRPGTSLAIPLLITKNDYDLHLFNGDEGLLVRSYSGEEYAYFSGRRFSLCMLPQFEYAYALSVHKSQGSEYQRVAFLIPPGSEVFGREVLYTAITRAKESLLIDADLSILKNVMTQSSKRYSNLSIRL